MKTRISVWIGSVPTLQPMEWNGFGKIPTNALCKGFFQMQILQLQIILKSLAFSISAFQSPFFWNSLTLKRAWDSRKRALSLNLQGKDPNKNHEDITQLNNTGKSNTPRTPVDVSSIFFFPVQDLKLAVTRGYIQDSNNFGVPVRLNPKNESFFPWPWPDRRNVSPPGWFWKQLSTFLTQVGEWMDHRKVGIFAKFFFCLRGDIHPPPPKKEKAKKKLQFNFKFTVELVGFDTCWLKKSFLCTFRSPDSSRCSTGAWFLVGFFRGSATFPRKWASWWWHVTMLRDMYVGSSLRLFACINLFPFSAGFGGRKTWSRTDLWCFWKKHATLFAQQGKTRARSRHRRADNFMEDWRIGVEDVASGRVSWQWRAKGSLFFAARY